MLHNLGTHHAVKLAIGLRREVFEKIGSLSLKPLVTAMRHRLFAEIDAARRNREFAHGIEKLSASAADIEHIRAAGEEGLIELLMAPDVILRAKEAPGETAG